MYLVGIHLANRAHELCVVDEQGAVVERSGFGHSERGIGGMPARLAKLAEPGELPVVMEWPDGPLVDRLLEAGHEVVPIHANAFHAARPRWVMWACWHTKTPYDPARRRHRKQLVTVQTLT